MAGACCPGHSHTPCRQARICALKQEAGRKSDVPASTLCHARAGGHPVTTDLRNCARHGLLDRPVEPGDDNEGLGELIPALSPPSRPIVECFHLVLLKGRSLEAFKRAGRGCGACGFRVTHAKRSGGAGAPPGPTTRSCKELADDGRPFRTCRMKRGPVPTNAANEHAFGFAAFARF